ncbi:DUF899 domain-containing protein [Opitutaceae bacterium EW11]|nr:DUF899 domain-containing protein [Opitutaceae bacterium EW11]
MDYPRVATREEWLQSRLALLQEEKALTKARDRVNTHRRELPMVRLETDYTFDAPNGKVRLIDLFGGRLQLIVYHFMWRWENGEALDEPCRGCSGFADQIARGHFNCLHERNTELVFVSRAPLAKILAFNRRMGWKLPWFSSVGTSFNYDFGVSFDPAVRPMSYNYRTPEEHEKAGTGYCFANETPFDLHGISCFLRRDDEVFHTYSTYARGAEDVLGPTRMLDLTALGRQEAWEEPKSRAAGLAADPGPPPRYPDEYADV